MALAEKQAVQPLLPPLLAIPSFEGLDYFAAVLNLGVWAMEQSTGHEEYLPVGKAWYLPG
jgi:hypothetical protein